MLASPLTGLTGLIVICGVMFSDQLTRTPLEFWELFWISSVQVPLASEPTSVESLPVG